MIAAALKHMFAAGMSHEAILSAVEDMEASVRPKSGVERTRAYRERCNDVTGDVTGYIDSSNTSDSISNPGSPPIVPPSGDFDQFWNHFPRKIAKGAARKAYRSALKRATHAEILAGVDSYRHAMASKDPEFTKHPSTWLNADCWLDESGTILSYSSGPKRTWAEIKAERANGQG